MERWATPKWQRPDTKKIRKIFTDYLAEFDPRKYLGPARDELVKMIQHKNKNVLGSVDQGGQFSHWQAGNWKTITANRSLRWEGDCVHRSFFCQKGDIF